LFDIFILGFYFGGTKLLERFYFLQDDLSNYIGSLNNFDSLKRADIVRFSLNQFLQFKFFGYGVGAYEIIFKVFNNNSFFFANHAHSDIIEFLGELGILGFSILCYLLLKLLKKINLKTTKNIFLIIYLITLLIFDFSFHIYLIQLIFILLISLNIKKTQI
jgi:O-antigen ligase